MMPFPTEVTAKRLPVLALCVALVTSACIARSAEPAPGAKRAEAEQPAIATRVAPLTVTETKMPKTATFSGSLVADRQSVVAAGATGKVVETLVERGDYVAQGALLARLDRRQAAAMLAEAEAALATANEQATLAKADCERTEQLHARQALADAEYDRIRSSCATTQFSLQASQARRDNAANALRDMEIRAPFAGFVEERWVSVGEFVAASNKVATIVAVNPIRARLSIPESNAASVAQGQSVLVEIADKSGPKVVEGIVRYVSPSLREATRDLVVEAVIDNPDRTLRPGTFVVAHLKLGEQAVLAVPKTAIATDGTSHYVFAIVDGLLEQRIVQTGPSEGDLVAITRGVRNGETIAAVASPELRDGGRVR